MGARRNSIWRTALAAGFACAAGLAIFHAATDGFQAFTLESARRLKALRAPVPIPALELDMADGGRARLTDLDAPVLLVDFVYTRCQTYCAALGSVYAQLQERLAAEIAAGTVRLVSISFDPDRDDPAALRAYRARHARAPDGWSLGRPAARADLDAWLSAFGVVVIPDGLGGYTHNAAVHVIGPDRRLVAIHGLENVDGVAATARALLERPGLHAAAR